MDDVFKALADPTRRQLLDRLRAQPGQTLRELCADVAMARQSVSKHLAQLEGAGLVTTVRHGREKLHYVNAAPINEIAERWINRYDQPRVDALSDLKKALEEPTVPSPDDKPEFVYRSYIHTTPEQLWQALTEPAFTRRYWQNLAFKTDWSVGSTMTWDQNGTPVTDPSQIVLAYDPYTRLAYTWHAYTPEWAAASTIDEDRRATLASEPHSTVTFDIEEADEGRVKLTVTHGNLTPGGLTGRMVGEGWPRVISDLKTLLESPPAA